MFRKKTRPFNADEVLPKLPAVRSNQFWVIGENEAWSYEPSGIRREFGEGDYVLRFGVALYENTTAFFGLVKKVKCVGRYTGKVARTEKDVLRVARILAEGERKARIDSHVEGSY